MVLGLLLFYVCVLFGTILDSSFASKVIDYESQVLQAKNNPLFERILQAATREVDLTTRSVDISLQHELEMHYLEVFNPSIAKSALSATVSLKPKLPSLLVESLEHLLDEIYCEAGFVRLAFKSDQHMEGARKAIGAHREFLLVTSHPGCNSEGSRLPWLVSSYDFSGNLKTVTLSAQPVPWKDTFHSIQVKFGQSENILSPRPHIHGRYRRDTAPLLVARTAPTAVATSSIGVLSSVSAPSTTTGNPTVTSISFPVPASTETAVATSITDDIGRQYINYPLLPSNNSALADAEGQVLPAGLKVQCANCTTRGTVELSSGSFTMNTTSNDTNLLDLIQDGYVKFTANNLSAHIALETTWQAGIEQTYTANLATIPLQPISIPDLAVIGPLFNPRLILGARLDRDLDFTYGFEITVPDNSSIVAKVRNVTESTITGFQDTNFSLLPFQSTISSLALNLSATLQAEILIGISFLGGAGNAGFGAFLTLPELAVQIAQVSGTNDKCEPLSNSSVVNGILEPLGNLTHVIPQVALEGGLIAQVTLGADRLEKQTSYAPFATTFSAPTACLDFDKKGSSYIAATATATSAGASSSGDPGGKQKGGAERMRNPFAKVQGEMGRFRALLMGLPIVCAGFLIL